VNKILELLRRKRVWIPLAALIVYALFGFLVLPGILRDQIVQNMRTTLEREVRLDRVRVNPLIFSLALEGFELKDPDGTSFVAFDRMYADFQLSSMVRWAITFRKFRLDGPKIHIRLMPDGQLNFADMVQPPPADAKPAKPPRLVIGSFEIARGSTRLTNLMEAEPEDGTLEPIDLTLENFTTIPDREGRYGIVASDPSGGTWRWNGDLTFEPMHSAGVLEISDSRLRKFWEIAQRRFGFEVTDGRFDCRVDYAVDVRGDSIVARINDSAFGVTGFALRAKGADPELLRIDSLRVTGVQVRYPEQTAHIERVQVSGPRVAAWMNPDTTVNWQLLFPVPAATDTAPPAPLWTATIAEISVRDAGIAFEDRRVKPPFAVNIAPAHATIRNFSSQSGAAFDLTTDVTIADRGRLTTTGKVVAEPPSADLQVALASLPLTIFQPYLNPSPKLQLISGTLDAKGALQYREGPTPEQPDIRYQGSVASRSFLARDRIANDRFLAWKQVTASGIDYAPTRVRVGAVRLNQPFAKILIHKNRTTNIQDIFGLPTDTVVVTKPSEALAQMKKSAAEASPIPVRIGSITVVDGSADFADFSLLLPFGARIEQIAGSATELSSDSASRSKVTLDGRSQPSGVAKVRGEVNPLAEQTYLDLDVDFEGFNMPTLTPYTGQFLGREVDKGRMSLDLNYRLEGRHLVGENKILLDQFELGEKVESPEATKLPVGLAIAILKDREGKINLDMPIEGDLDDPKFSIWRVVWNFIMSLLTKIATAPFALLGSLFGGGSADELSHVDFEAGASAMPADQTESVDKLASALGQRPQLSIEVRGRSDAEADASAIRNEKFAAQAQEKIAADPKKYGGIGYSPRLLEELYLERYDKQALAAFKKRFETPAGQLEPTNPSYKAGSKKVVVDPVRCYAAIQDSLTALQPVDDSDLLALANARSNAIKNHLVQKGVEEARVFVTDPAPGKVENGRIRIDLTLTD
jgi:Domain of Unknown Function (DUF748)